MAWALGGTSWHSMVWYGCGVAEHMALHGMSLHGAEHCDMTWHVTGWHIIGWHIIGVAHRRGGTGLPHVSQDFNIFE